MFFDSKLDLRQTESQIKRRGLLKEGVDLPAIGIYPLREEQPDFDPTIQTAVDAGTIVDEAKGEARIDWNVQLFPLAMLLPALFERVAEKRWMVEEGGTVWSGHVVDTDRISQPKITSEFVAATNGLRTDGEYWKMKDGSFVPLTNAQLQEMALAVRAHITACFAREGTIKGLIAAADTEQEAFDAFTEEIGQGWPANDLPEPTPEP